MTDRPFLQSEHTADEPAGRALRDRSHIEDTLRLAAAEATEEFSSKEQIYPQITDMREIWMVHISFTLAGMHRNMHSVYATD